MTVLPGHSSRLTDAQKRHLREMQDIADSGSHNEAYWHPTGAEVACAQALARKGLLKQDFGYGSGGRGFVITDAGRAVDVDA